jgi:hypothetical protein
VIVTVLGAVAVVAAPIWMLVQWFRPHTPEQVYRERVQDAGLVLESTVTDDQIRYTGEFVCTVLDQQSPDPANPPLPAWRLCDDHPHPRTGSRPK